MVVVPECQICAKASADCDACPGCGAFFYCCQRHQVEHSRMGHTEECGRMARQMLRVQVKEQSQTA
jgi:hypothetical protein